MTISVITVASTKQEPIQQINVANAAGYFDLIINKTANGKAIRIASRQGEPRVHITLGAVDDLINALKLVKEHGVATSVESLLTNNA